MGVIEVLIRELYQRLLETARQKIRAGELTERGLARMCGISQPHMHNVLKSCRSLSPASADRLMEALGTNVPCLVFQAPARGETGVRAIPLVRNRIGPGCDAVLSSFRGFMPFSEGSIVSLVEPVVAQLAPDLVLPNRLAANDFALLDQNPVMREQPPADNCWVVQEDAGLRVRYVKLVGAHVYLANEMTVRNPLAWQPVPFRGRNTLETVRARIVGIFREMETGPTASFDASGSGHRSPE